MQEDPGSGNRGQPRPEPLDDLLCAQPALGARLQIHENAAGVDGYVDAAYPHRRHERLDIGILFNDGSQLLLMAYHGVERDPLYGLGESEYLAGILVRKKSFRHDNEKIDGQRENDV